MNRIVSATNYFQPKFLWGILFIFFLHSCVEDIEPEIPNEEELISTLRLTLESEESGENYVFLFQDLDGDGGNEPFIQVPPVCPSGNYISTVEVLNELYQPTVDITEEVEEEGVEHQFFYEFSSAEQEYIYTDSDENGNPIGINGEITLQNAEMLQLRITLRHEPNKTAEGVAMGNIDNAGGETDIEVIFDFYVE